MDKHATLRFGLAGTGYWAQQAHATALKRTPGVELNAVWGHNREHVTAFAEHLGIDGIPDFDTFLDRVDAVSFAVPPAVQSTLALRAIRAGKHVLLEKPIAVSLETAEALAEAATEHNIASVTFFTPLFDPRMRTIMNKISSGDSWRSGHGLWLSDAFDDDSPFNTPWRRIKGALWDLGPHALATLWVTLGPIHSISAVQGNGDLVHLMCAHKDGATSTATMALSAGPAAAGFSTMLWGDRGRLDLPVDDVDNVEALVLALTELTTNIRGRVTAHSCDIHFGRDIVRLLVEAEQSLNRAWPVSL